MTIIQFLDAINQDPPGAMDRASLRITGSAAIGPSYADLTIGGSRVGSIRYDPVTCDMTAITLNQSTTITILRRVERVLPADIPLT